MIERNPNFIASQLRAYRKSHGLTQESLAALSGISTRTVEKLESGRHQPQEQTIRSISRALGVHVTAFQQTTTLELELQKATDFWWDLKSVPVLLYPCVKETDFVCLFGRNELIHVDPYEVKDQEALSLACNIADMTQDVFGIIEELGNEERLDVARDLVTVQAELQEAGYTCHSGSYRCQLTRAGDLRLIRQIGVMKILPNESKDDVRWGKVRLEEGWQRLAEDQALVDMLRGYGNAIEMSAAC